MVEGRDEVDARKDHITPPPIHPELRSGSNSEYARKGGCLSSGCMSGTRILFLQSSLSVLGLCDSRSSKLIRGSRERRLFPLGCVYEVYEVILLPDSWESCFAAQAYYSNGQY
jgi:hypothetical protein